MEPSITSHTADCSEAPGLSITKTLLGLPNELLLRAAEFLPTVKDLGNLRLCCRKLSGVACEAQSKCIQVLFLDLSRASLQRFHEVCHHPTFAQGIKEIILICATQELSGTQMIQDRHANKEFRRAHLPGSTKKALLDRYEKLVIEQRELLRNEVVLETLQDCLPLLTRRSRLTFWDRPRLQLPPDVAYNRARVWRYEHCLGQGFPDEPALDARQLSYEDFVCNHVLHHMLFCPPQLTRCSPSHLLEAEIGTERSFSRQGLKVHFAQYPLLPYLGCDSPTPVLAALGDRLTTLKVDFKTVKDRQIVESPALDEWASMVGQAKWLKSLSIREPCMASGGVYAIKRLLQTCTFPALEELELMQGTCWRCDSETPEASKFQDDWCHSTQDLNRFLLRHRPTLKHTRILSASGAEPGNQSEGDIAALSDLLESIKENMNKLESARFIEVFMNLGPHHMPGIMFSS
jgi:hypothetical protein